MSKHTGRPNISRDILIYSVKEMQTKIWKCYFMSIRLATGRKLENALCPWRCGQDAGIWPMGKQSGGGPKERKLFSTAFGFSAYTPKKVRTCKWVFSELYAWWLGTWRLSGGSYHCPSLTNFISRTGLGTSLVVQWLRFCVPNAQGESLVGELRSHMPSHPAWCGKKITETKKDIIRRKFLKKNRIDKDVESFIFS